MKMSMAALDNIQVRDRDRLEPFILVVLDLPSELIKSIYRDLYSLYLSTVLDNTSSVR